jgi:hypothetical protein
MSVAPWINDSSAARPSVRKRSAKPRGAVEVAPRRGVLARALRHAVGFAFLSFCCYGFLSLMGHSLHSSAYKARANAEIRTESARQDVLELSRQVGSLVSTESLDRWARVHGFGRPGTLVAMNHGARLTTSSQ